MVEPHQQPRVLGAAVVLPVEGVLVVAPHPGADIDHLDAGGADSGKVDVSLPLAHVNAAVFPAGGRVQGKGGQCAAQTEQRGEQGDSPFAKRAVKHG